MNLITVPTLTESEELELMAVLANPVLRKYLTVLGTGIAQNLCLGQPSAEEADSLYIRREMQFKGQLALIETLLSIPVKE